jgi:hypothetical protein
MVWIVGGNLAKIECGIRELNFGAIRRMDRDGKMLGQGTSADGGWG